MQTENDWTDSGHFKIHKRLEVSGEALRVEVPPLD